MLETSAASAVESSVHLILRAPLAYLVGMRYRGETTESGHYTNYTAKCVCGGHAEVRVITTGPNYTRWRSEEGFGRRFMRIPFTRYYLSRIATFSASVNFANVVTRRPDLDPQRQISTPSLKLPDGHPEMRLPIDPPGQRRCVQSRVAPCSTFNYDPAGCAVARRRDGAGRHFAVNAVQLAVRPVRIRCFSGVRS